LHPLPSAAVSAVLPRGHVALAFVVVGVGFADRAAVVAVGFSQDLWVLHIGICITPEIMSTFDTNRILKQALQYKPKGRRNIGLRKRWRDQFHFEDQGTGNIPNPS